MLHPHPLTPVPTSGMSPFVLSCAEWNGIYSLQGFERCGSSFIRHLSREDKTAVLNITPTGYTHFVREGFVFSAVERPDGSVLSIERADAGQLHMWTFATHDDFLHRRGSHQDTQLYRLARLGETVFAKALVPSRPTGDQATELLIWSHGAWKPLGLFGERTAPLRAISKELLWFAEGIHRWDGETLTHLTDIERSYCEDVQTTCDGTRYILEGRTLSTISDNGALEKTSWTVTNIMSIESLGGLIFASLGDNKRSWISAVFEPNTGRSRGFKRKEFGLQGHSERTNQWLVDHDRLFALTTTRLYEIDLTAIQALRKTRLKS